MKAVLDLIMGIVKEYGVLALLAFLIGVITVTIMPQEKIEILPFETQNVYMALLTAMVFWLLIIFFFKYMLVAAGRSIRKMISNEDKYAIEQEKQRIHEFIDKFDSYEKEMLNKFMNSNNEPIPFGGNSVHFGNEILLNSNWVDITEKTTKVTEVFRDPQTGEKTTGYIYYKYVAKLKPHIYEMLRILREEDGRLGNFD